jgi:glycerate kinase
VKIVCAPDSFKESISAVGVANAMARGISSVQPDANIDTCPIGDGGEGTLDALLEARAGRRIGVLASNVFGEPSRVCFGVFADAETAFVETASVIGLQTIPEQERRVMESSSYGVGEMLLAAASATRILVGVGGSATNDGGCGMAQAIGYRFLNDRGIEIGEHMNGRLLGTISHIDPSGADRRLRNIKIEVVCDVKNPLAGPDGASFVFAPQKGATEYEVETLDDGLCNLARVIRHDLDIDIETLAGSGAAGGLAGGLVAFAGAEIRPGIEAVLEAVEFSERIRDADLCLTGEGRLDAQSLSGKACIGVAQAAAAHGVPTVALVGSIGDGAERSLEAGLDDFVVIGEGLSHASSMNRADELLAKVAGRIVENYVR